MRVCVFLTILATVIAKLPSNLYSTLGLNSRASVKEIKRAYKNLAREWHPDKNDSPEAAEKFMEISKAYEVLSDPLKKERYDKFGTVDESPALDRGGYGHGFFDPFFGFAFEEDNSYFKEHRISMRQYTHSLLEMSHHQPFLLFAYSMHCRLCSHLEPVWKEAVADLESIGYGVGTVFARTDMNLLDKLRISRVPSIVVLIEGRVIHYRGDIQRLTSRSLRLFCRDVMPNTALLRIPNYSTLKRFLDQAKAHNKISVLILGASPDPRTRYLTLAMKMSDVARFAYGYLGVGTEEMDHLREAISIKCTKCENVIIFDEYPEKGPIARLSISNANQLTQDVLTKLIEDNKWLVLPRISSPVFLDGLCPVSSRNPRMLCFVLVSVGSSDGQLVDSYRQFAHRHKTRMGIDHARLVYISADTQKLFLLPFMAKRSDSVQENRRDVLVIWRVEHVKARFTWLEGAWGEGMDHSLLMNINQIISGSTTLDWSARVADVVDEHEPSFFVKFSRKVYRFLETASFELSKEETYPVISTIFAFLAILVIGFVLSYLNNNTKEKAPSRDTSWHPDDPLTDPPKQTNPQRKIQKVMSVMSPLMHELRAESYYGMIRLLKPGCRSLIVLVDNENKTQLLEQFAMAVYGLRNNKTFSFGFLLVEKNLPWFRKLLEHTLPPTEGMHEKLKGINPRLTVGTVIVLCGWKLYFSIYHPMHATKRKHFLGFDDEIDSDESSDEEVRPSYQQLSVKNVLNGLPNWLDRVLEGSVRRYYIPEWPDNLV